MNRVRKLSPGDTIGIFPCSSPVSPQRFEKGKAEMERRGYSIFCPFDPTSRYGEAQPGYSCGTVEERIGALMALLGDSRVGAIIAARGAFGAMELLPALPYGEISKAGKLIVGFSDVTFLLAAIHGQCGIPVIHGPMLGTEFAKSPEDNGARTSVDLLLSLLTDEGAKIKLEGEVLRAGQGEGKIIAGNLSVLTAMLGLPWDISYDGAILIVEDLKEVPHRIYMKLLQLKLSGKLEKLAGLVYGRFSGCESSTGPTVDTVLRSSIISVLNSSTYPVLMGVEVGHNGLNTPLPFGCRGRITESHLEVIESPLTAR